MARKPRILFLCHGLAPVGGDRVVAAWMLQALAPLYDVNILTWENPDLGALDRAFGTQIAGEPFQILTPPPRAAWLIDRIPDGSFHQRANYLLRMARQQRHNFDALISATFEADFCQPAIQYLHYPYLARRIHKCTIAGDAPLPARLRGLLSRRTQPWMLISGYSFERLRSNRTLTNSAWTCAEAERLCGIATEVLYPPAPGDFIDRPWEQRRDAFVSIGRLNPEKRVGWIVEIMARVHREAPGVELHICGFPDRPKYVRELEQLAAVHGPWIRIHQKLPRSELIGLMADCRYGIHAMLDEHFGIAPAEMARAGCIPFVHSSGGQVEIVDRDPRLCYTTVEEAAAKILAVMRNPEAQKAIHSAVLRHSRLFTPEAFVEGFRRHVADFLARRPTPEANGIDLQRA